MQATLVRYSTVHESYDAIPPRLTLLHHLCDEAVARYPRLPAVTCGMTTVTYQQANLAGRRLAGWLRALGLQRGDRMVVSLPAHPHTPSLCYGASRAGVVFAVVHEQVRGHALAHVLRDCEPALVVTDADDARQLAAQHKIKTVGAADMAAAATRPDTLGENGGLDEPGQAGPLEVDPVCLIYTSGSTAMPKAVVSTHQQVMFAVHAIQGSLAYRPDDTIYSVLPLSFDYGLYQVFLTTASGAHLHLGTDGAVGQLLVSRLRSSGATVFPAMPALAESLLLLLRRDPASPPLLRLMTSTGAAMPEATLNGLRRLIPTLRVQLMYGLTECKRVSIMPPDEDLTRPGCCGRPLPGTEVLVVDHDGARLKPRAVGEFVVRGPHVMAGYWRAPEATAQRFRRVEGLFPQLNTGDYGWLDEDGYLYFVGRRDDIYKQNGFRVSAIEVESAALRIHGIGEAAVVPPGDGRSAATLFAVTRLAPAAVLRAIRSELEDFKVPSRCVVVERLPLTGHGKPDRQALIALLDGKMSDVAR
jgi:acyl-CoA synthetase (AMP-forming)/AMP-acid ligase II